jgi:hypothetical protein
MQERKINYVSNSFLSDHVDGLPVGLAYIYCLPYSSERGRANVKDKCENKSKYNIKEL